MKRIYALGLCILALAFTDKSYGQGDLDLLLKGSQADANYLAEGYVTPALNSFGSALNQGWYNTAQPHKLLGFDITLSTSLIFFPASDQFYQVDNNRLTTLKIVSPTDGRAPTVFGPDQAPTYDVKTGPSAPFDGPPGIDPESSIGINAMPVPIANFGIGLPKSTDLKIRFVPTIRLGDADVSMFGIGVMHDIKQHIPKIKSAPFDLSAFVGYTSFKVNVPLDANFPDQVNTTEFTATTIQAIIGKKLSVLTVYGSVGYNFSSGSIKVKGTYASGTGGPALVDPINLNSSISGPRISAGLRLKLLIFTFHGDYTLQTYNTLTVGFGLAIR